MAKRLEKYLHVISAVFKWYIKKFYECFRGAKSEYLPVLNSQSTIFTGCLG